MQTNNKSKYWQVGLNKHENSKVALKTTLKWVYSFENILLRWSLRLKGAPPPAWLSGWKLCGHWQNHKSFLDLKHEIPKYNIRLELHERQLSQKKSMECSSMVSIAAFGPRHSGSNPSWFAVSNSNKKLSFHE